MWRWAFLLVLGLMAMAPVPPAMAQQLGVARSPILTIDPDRLYADSAFGQRVARELEADSAVLAAENGRIQAKLTEEERELTDRRATMDAGAFRTLADAFDEKVQTIRRQQDAKTRSLNTKQEASRIMFFNAARPVLENLMREAQAAVILERTTVFLSANVSDVTDLAIARIDAALGEGPEELPSGDTP